MDLNTIEKKIKEIKNKDFDLLNIDEIFNTITDLKEIFVFMADITKDKELKELAETPREAKRSFFVYYSTQEELNNDKPFSIIYKHLKNKPQPFYDDKHNLIFHYSLTYNQTDALFKSLAADTEHKEEDIKESITQVKALIKSDVFETLKVAFELAFIINNETLKPIFSLQNYKAFTDKGKSGIIRSFKHKTKNFKMAFIPTTKSYKTHYINYLKETNKAQFIDFFFYRISRAFTLTNLIYFYREDTPSFNFTESTKEILNAFTKNNLLSMRQTTEDNTENARESLLYDFCNNFETIDGLTILFNLFLDLHNYTLNKTSTDEETTAILKPSKKEINFTNNNFLINKNLKLADTLDRNFILSERKLYKKAKESNLETEAEQYRKGELVEKKIKAFKNKVADFKGTDREALELIKEPSIIDYMRALGFKKELEDAGFSYEILKDKQTETYIKSKVKNVSNIMNIEDRKLYIEYGRELLKTKQYIEAKAIGLMLQSNNIEALQPTTLIPINPNEYNAFFNLKNDVFYTKNLLLNNIKLLMRRTILYENTEKNGILQTPFDKVKNDKKLSEENKKKIIELLNKSTIETRIIADYVINKDEFTNQGTIYIMLDVMRILFYKLLFLNTRFIEDNTAPLQITQGRQNKRARAEFIRDYFLLYFAKVEKSQKENTKLFNIDTLLKPLIDGDYIKPNKRKLKESVKTPLEEALNLLKESGVIEYQTDAFTFYEEQTAQHKKNFYKTFLQKQISITIKNDNF